eukprot:2268968-Prymnesium_polylepis.1
MSSARGWYLKAASRFRAHGHGSRCRGTEHGPSDDPPLTPGPAAPSTRIIHTCTCACMCMCAVIIARSSHHCRRPDK